MPYLGRSGNEPIDLTGSDNEDDLPQPGAKRARVNGVDNSFIPQLPTREDHLLATRANPNQVLFPNFQPLSQPLAIQPQWISQSTPAPFQGRAWSSQPTHIQLSQQLAALNRAQMRSTPSSLPSHVISAPPQTQFGQNPPHIIDLTRESPMSRSPSIQPMQPTSAPNQTLVLDDNLPPTTTILIGQITVSALVLNPVPYIQQQTPGANSQYSNSMDYVPVKLRPANEKPDAHDILVFTPAQSRNGSLIAPESFAVVESKVSVKLQPLMNKRALKLEGMMRTVQSGSNVCFSDPYVFPSYLLNKVLVNPMVILVLTAKGNVSQIAE
ncbi:17033_t:CDS:1, partial [Acaulospora colombiana]